LHDFLFQGPRAFALCTVRQACVVPDVGNHADGVV
jgi:hypothetical protein